VADDEKTFDEPQAPSRATAIVKALADDPELRESVKQALAAEPSGLDTALLRAYKDAALAYREASAAAKAAGEVKADLEQQVGDVMALDGSWKWSDGSYTLSCNEFRFAAFPEGKEAAVHALRKTDWAEVAAIAMQMLGTSAKRDEWDVLTRAEWEAAEEVLREKGILFFKDSESVPLDEKQAFDHLCRALFGDDTGSLLAFGFNSNSLSAYVRERVERAEAEAKREGRVLADDQDALPYDWKGVIEVGSKWRVGVTASKR